MAGTKRSRSTSPFAGAENPPKSNAPGKRARISHNVDIAVDPIYGQRNALPTDGDDEDGFDAMSYLRSVRQEADGIPTILSAPQHSHGPNTNGEYDRSIYENGVGDYRGYYSDGAYFAAPSETTSTNEPSDFAQDLGQDPQLAYFDSILARFEALRAQLHQNPPRELVKALDKDHPTHVARLETRNSRWWRWKMRTVDPLPVQVAKMDKGTVLRLLRLLMSGHLLRRGGEVNLTLSRWVWALLARLPDVGEMTSDEVGVVRDLGKKAVLVGAGLRKSEEWDEGLDECENELEGEEDGEAQVKVTNNDELQLDDNDDEASAPVESSALAKKAANDLNRPTQATSDTNHPGSEAGLSDFEAIKARMLASINQVSAAEPEPTPESTEAQGAEPPPNDGDNVDNDENDESKIVEGEEQADETTMKKDSTPEWNAQVTVDMIITVAGELYGQRDLLEFRQVWGEVSE